MDEDIVLEYINAFKYHIDTQELTEDDFKIICKMVKQYIREDKQKRGG